MIDYGHHHPQKSPTDGQAKNLPGPRYPGDDRGSAPGSQRGPPHDIPTSRTSMPGNQPFSAASLTTTTSVTSSSTAHGMPFHSTASFHDSAGLARPSPGQPAASAGMSSSGMSGTQSAAKSAAAGLSGLPGVGLAGVAGAAALMGGLQQTGLPAAMTNPLALLGGTQMFQAGGLLGATSTPAVENPALSLQNILAQQQSQPKSAANFSNDDLKKLLGTLKEIERQVKQKEQEKKSDPLQQLALAAQLQALSAGPTARPTSEQQVAAVAKTIPLTQQEALKKLSNVMNEQDMGKLMNALKDIEKKTPASAVPEQTGAKPGNEAQMQYGQRGQSLPKKVEDTRGRAKQSRFSPIDDSSRLKKNPSPPRHQISVLNTRGGSQPKPTSITQPKPAPSDDDVLNQAPWQTTKPPPWANKDANKPSSDITVTPYAKQMVSKQPATKPGPSSSKPEVCINLCLFCDEKKTMP